MAVSYDVDAFLNEYGADAFPVRYAATAGSLEGIMFSDLLGLCAAAWASARDPARSEIEIVRDDVILTFDGAHDTCLRLRQMNSRERLLMVRDPTSPDVVWFCCTKMDWLSFIVMLHDPVV